MRNKWNYILILLLIFILVSCDVPLTTTDLVPDRIEPSPSILDDDNYDRFFNRMAKKTLVIEVSSDDYQYLNREMIDYYNQFGTFKDDTYIPASVTYEDDLGTLSIKDIGFRTRGNLSRGPLYDQEGNVLINHFKLKFNETFTDIDTLGYLFGLEELDMKYNRNYDPTYMNELGSLQMYEAFDVYAQKATLVHVTLKLDDIDYPIGVMTAFEPIDEWFIQRRFEGRDATGDLYKTLWQQTGPSTLRPLSEGDYGIKDVSINYRPGYDLKTNKDTSTHDALIRLVEALNHSDKRFVDEAIQTYFDLDYLARYFAVSLILGNPDDFRSMGNNYYLYHAPMNDKFYIIPYDLDHSLGYGWGGEPTFTDQLVDTNIYHMNELSEALSETKHEHPLIEHLFLMDAFKEKYEFYLLEIIQSETFTLHHFEKQIDTFRAFYQEEVALSMIDLGFGTRNLKFFIEGKIESIERQLNP